MLEKAHPGFDPGFDPGWGTEFGSGTFRAPTRPFLRRTAAFIGRTYPLPARCRAARGIVMLCRHRFALLALCALLFAADAALAESGIASAYPRSYQGRRTASGEHLD